MTPMRQFLHDAYRTAQRTLPILLTRRILVASVLFWGPVIAFVGLADEVLDGDTLAYDRAVLEFINRTLASPSLDPYIVALTNLAGVTGATIITVAALLLLLARGYRRSAAFVAAVVGGATVMNVVLKLLFARDRPSLFETIVLETSYSFPSGHAMISSALAFAAMVLVWRTRFRWPLIAGAALFFLSISFTRLYLGVHYPTDVIGGWCISAAWVVIMYFALRMDRRWSLTKPDQARR